MKKKVLWMLAATRPMVLTMVFCGTTLGLTACKEAKAQEDNPVQQVTSEELIRTSQPVILYMFYLSQKDLPLAVQHPEIPLD